MTYTIYSGYTNIVGNAFTMATGDVLQTLAGSVLASTGGNGVNATGSVAIEVAGTVGGVSNGIYDGTAAGDGSTVYIDKTGYVFSGFGQQGVYIQGAGTHTIVNSGAVQSSGMGGWGVAANGAGMIVNEAGGLISAGTAIRENDATATDTNDIFNYGTIVGTAYAFAGFGADKELLDNQGTMVGSVYMSSNAADLLYNAGTMDATNTSNSTGFNVNNSAVDNFGVMYQLVAGSTATTMIKTGDGAGDYVYNTGTIAVITGNGASPASAAIAMGNGAGDYVDNLAGGHIYGNVLLGNGAGDIYSGAQGKLTGTIVCGSGGDTVYTGSDFEVAKAGSGNDTFTAGTGGETIIQETAAVQLSNGYDIVSNFQAYNAPTQQGTFLQIGASLQATTGFMSDGAGGTYVYMGLGGGTYSYIDVLGASVAQVKAQTYFA